MNDPLANLYSESVANPTKHNKKIDFGKDNKVGSKVDEDFGAKKAGQQKNTGPEAAEGFKKEKKKALKEETEMKDENNNEPEVGSQFDALFGRAIKEDFDPEVTTEDDDMSFGDTGDDDQAGFGDEFSDDEKPAGEETDLRSVLTNVIEQLQEVLNNVEGGGEEGGEGHDDTSDDVENLDMQRNFSDEEDDDEQLGEADAGGDKARDGKIHKAPDGKSGLQGKSNKVGGYFGKKTGGTATGAPGGEKPRDGKLRPAPGYKALQGKDNKVRQSGVPGRQGSSLFD